MDINGDDLQEIVEILGAIDRLQLVEGCSARGNDNADRLRDILVTQELDGAEADAEIDGSSGEKKPTCSLKNATRRSSRVCHSSM